MADTSNLSNYLKDIADAIREKKGTEDPIPAANFDEEIKTIEASANLIIDTQKANLDTQPLGTITNLNSGSLYNNICLVKNKVIAVTKESIVIYDYILYKEQKYSLSDLLGTVPSVNVISIGANNPNDIGSNFYYILLSTISNTDYLLLYDYDTDTIYSESFNTCKSPISINSGANTVGNINPYYNIIAYTYNVNTGHYSSKGNIYKYVINFSEGTTSREQLYSSDGFWAPYPRWYKEGKVLATSTFYNSGQWTGQKMIILFNDDFTSSKVVELQNRSSSPSVGFVFNEDLTLCLKGLDLYSVNYTPSTSINLTLLQSNALSLKDFSSASTQSATNSIFFTRDNKYLIVKSSNTQISLLKLNDSNYFDLVTQCNVPSCDYLIKSVNDIFCTSGTTDNIIFLNPEQDISYLLYDDKKYWNYEDNLLDITSANVIYRKKYIGADTIEKGTMPNNGLLNYPVSTSEQTIPEGYTSGGTIEASPLLTEEYQNCLSLSESILSSENAYTKLTYVKNMGGAYIDTGIIATGNTTIEVQFDRLGITTGVCLFGAWGNGKALMTEIRSSNVETYSNTTTDYRTFISVPVSNFGNIITVKASPTKIEYIKDGSVINSNSFNAKSWTTNLPIYLFCRNVDGATNEKGALAFYYCKIWDNDTLVRDFIPVNLYGENCIFDLVSKTFYYAANNIGYFTDK